jgi:hypothetical protein
VLVPGNRPVHAPLARRPQSDRARAEAPAINFGARTVDNNPAAPFRMEVQNQDHQSSPVITPVFPRPAAQQQACVGGMKIADAAAHHGSMRLTKGRSSRKALLKFIPYLFIGCTKQSSAGPVSKTSPKYYSHG